MRLFRQPSLFGSDFARPSTIFVVPRYEFGKALVQTHYRDPMQLMLRTSNVGPRRRRIGRMRIPIVDLRVFTDETFYCPDHFHHGSWIIGTEVNYRVPRWLHCCNRTS